MRIVRKHLVVGNDSIPLSRMRSVFVLAVGKAAASMMRAAFHRLGALANRGIIVCPATQPGLKFDSQVQAFVSGHPIPNRAGVTAARKVIQAVGDLSEDDLLLCLISGGASAMLPAPAKGITLQDKILLTNQLVRSGATIHEINAVRRHISRLKGGGLIQICPASRIVSLIVSDVPGNRLPDIGSGLTVEDPTSYHDAVEILAKYDIWQSTPQRVKDHLQQGIRGTIKDTPKPGSPSFQRVRNIIIADNMTACRAAQESLRKRKLRTSILTTSVEMEARDLGRLLAANAQMSRAWSSRTSRSRAMIVGGECVVRVISQGRGGRNQEVALSAVTGVAGLDGVAIAAMGTDGIDGNTKVAGAIIDGNTAQRARRRKLEPDRFLARNDSGRFFRLLGDYLLTGPTGTNVGDIYLMVSLR